MRYMPDCHFNNMVRLTNWQRQEIVIRMLNGETVAGIAAHLRTQWQGVCRQTIWRLKKKYEAYSHVNDLHGVGDLHYWPCSQALDMIGTKMQDNDETTGKELKKHLQVCGIKMSQRTILKGRKQLGWNFRGSAYCQLIRDVNKQKRLVWANANKDELFEDVIWTDETSVQLECHRRFCCRNGQKPRYKPRPTPLRYMFGEE